MVLFLSYVTIHELNMLFGDGELFRVFFTTSKQFGSASGGLYGADSFINQDWPPLTQSMVAYYASLCLLIAALFLFRFINGKRLQGDVSIDAMAKEIDPYLKEG